MGYGGIYPALITPFTVDGAVSVSDLKHNIQKYNQSDLAGYVVLGSTGEAVFLSSKESELVWNTVKEFASPEKKLIAGTGAESTAETIVKTKIAAQIGYHAALVKTPNFYKPMYRPEVLIAHYRKVAEESPIPIFLYSVPQFTGVTLDTPEVAALSEHPNIIGIKDSSGNVLKLGEMLVTVKQGFQVMTGSPAVLYPSLALGVSGAILAIGSAIPEKCFAVYDLFRHENYQQARELQYKLAPLAKTIAAEAGIAGIKFLMDLRGYRGGIPRLPLQPLSEAMKRRLSDMLSVLEPAKATA